VSGFLIPPSNALEVEAELDLGASFISAYLRRNSLQHSSCQQLLFNVPFQGL
jgi:hypothetical protein